LVAAVLTSSSLVNLWLVQPAEAQTKAYCQLSADAIAEKESLRSSALKGNPDAQTRYKALLKKHAERLQQCRSQTWPRTQAIWLRLYPCDIRQGASMNLWIVWLTEATTKFMWKPLLTVRCCCPVAENRTPWPSVVRTPGAEKVDLLAQAINKGHERGLKVYAWMFSMNFGYSYSQRSDRQEVLARDGKGQTSSLVVEDGSQVFIDPYNPLAKRDYYDLVQAMVRRRPDGVLFDYIRYPRQAGASSVVTKVQDLWIYGDGAREALYQRALNNKGRDLIQRYLTKGFIRAGDVAEVDKLYPQEGSPLWQGRKPPDEEMKATPGQRQPLLQWELWQLSVAHAAQGVLDFINLASQPATRQGITTGAVFFPEGNPTHRTGRL
jgi:hypothetical protein